MVTLLLTKQTGYTSFLRYSVQFSPKDNLVNTRELLGKPKGIKIIEINKDTNEWLIISKLTKEEIQKSLDNYLDKNQVTTKVTPKITLSPYIHAVFGGFSCFISTGCDILRPLHATQHHILFLLKRKSSWGYCSSH